MTPEEKQELLKQEFHQQTAKINWHDLQTYYAHGSVIHVKPGMDLVDVAVQLGMDNTDQFQQWIEQHQIEAVHDEQAKQWYESNQQLWAVVAPPWVLVQPI